MALFRILSLDGGGTWSLIQVDALIDMFGENTCGHEILCNYDLVASNSGGSTVLGALIHNMSLSQIREIYSSETSRRALFARLAPWKGLLDLVVRFLTFGYVGARYDSSKKRTRISNVLEDDARRRVVDLPGWIGDDSPQFLICSYDYDLNRAKFFRSDPLSAAASFPRGDDTTLADAVHASSAAPVQYFNSPAVFGDHRYWDGACGGYNNPTLAAVIEVLANAQRYNTSAAEIRVLSIGTGIIALPLGNPGDAWKRFMRALRALLKLRPKDPHDNLVVMPKKRNILRDVGKFADSILEDPPDAASFQAHILLGGGVPPDEAHPVANGPIVRLNPMVRPRRVGDRWEAPEGLEPEEVKLISDLPADALKQKHVKKIENLAQQWLQNGVFNQPIRYSRENSTAEIGHHRYEDAKAQAQVFGLCPSPVEVAKAA